MGQDGLGQNFIGHGGELSLAEPAELTLHTDALTEVGGDVHFALVVEFE